MRKYFLALVGVLVSLVGFGKMDGRPNIIIFMVDDMGFSDLGCFGGEVKTPNMDMLAQNGVRLTQFYNCARCCPTRASLLTGLYAQQVGLTLNGRNLKENCVTIAEVLKEAGYSTGMAGKWHLSETKQRQDNDEQLAWMAHQADYGHFAPLKTYPCNRGFEEHWGVIWGVVNYFDPFSLVHNEEPIKEVSHDFYMTDFVTDKSIDMIDDFSKKDKPFFLYIAHTAPHWPLHALPEDIEKYKGMYDIGWDSLRNSRYQRMIEMGLFDANNVPNGANESGQKWESEQNKVWEAKHMEVHAAMIDHVDQGLGKILDKLRENGEYENTIIFILADNGASPERPTKAGFDRPGYTRKGEKILYLPDHYNAPGAENTMAGIGQAWAGACNTPFRYWKKESFHGGNCTPVIINWPAGLKARSGSISNCVGHVKDIMPTCMELANAKYPQTYKGHDILPLEGKSILPALQNKTKVKEDTIYWEHEGGRAIRLGVWKAVALKNKSWELYNLKEDLSETKNLAGENPELLEQLDDLWQKWAVKVGLN